MPGAVMRCGPWRSGAVRDSSMRRDNPRATASMRDAGGAQHGGAGRRLSRRMRGGLFDQPYLLLSLTSLFWAGNTVLGRFIAGHVPPITLAFIRWSGAFLILLPFAALHLLRDWPTIRKHCRC